MLKKGALSINEKIYLSNKTLIDAKDLKIGDKILSLKILDDEINDIVDIYKKYIIENKPIENFELVESEIYSVDIINEKTTGFIELNENPIKNSQYICVDCTKEPSHKFLLREAYMIPLIDSEYKTKIRKLNPLFSTEELNSLKIFTDYEYIKKQNKEYYKESINLDIINGHFYFTEYFIVFAGNGN